MAKTLNDVAPKIPLFENHEKVKKEEIINEKLLVLGYAKLTSSDGDYGVMAFKIGDDLKSCTINTIMVERLDEAVEKIGLNEARSTKKEKYLAEPIEVTMISTESKTNANRSYFSFE